MKLAVTAMVRDEVDIIRIWLEYHLAQGVDILIITDNGSVDGTSEILAEYAERGVVDLRHDPVQRKQQATLVTAMAREAATMHGADWVINADADEFLIPKDRSLRLRDVFERLDPALRSFGVPVVNLVGPIARFGAGISRLVWRDERSAAQLSAVGVLAHPTHNAIHVADPEVNVAQGNHYVSIPSNGEPPDELALEVLHLPWRSWQQFEHKVTITGLAYDANPDLTPSPNHHGMRDYRRLQDGTVMAYYALRHVTDAEAEDGPFRRDDSLVAFLSAAAPEALTAAVDHPFTTDDYEVLARSQRLALFESTELVRSLKAAMDEADLREQLTQNHVAHLDGTIRELHAQIAEMRQRKAVRLVDLVSERAHQAAKLVRR